MARWNPWHGCRKVSPGCAHCYVYRIDAQHGLDASQVRRTRDFDLPVRKRRDGRFAIPGGETVWTCFSSDFLLEEADGWREEAWAMMAARPDLEFFFITKRIQRLGLCVPADWNGGYGNVDIGVTVEDQTRAEGRLPALADAPVPRAQIVCEPLLGPLDLSPWLGDGRISQVLAGGESGPDARPCRYEWVLSLRRQCRDAGVPFVFKQTGANFVKDGRVYHIPRSQQHSQAKKAGIDLAAPGSREPGDAEAFPN